MLGVEALLPEVISRKYSLRDFVEPLRKRIDTAREADALGDVIDWALVSSDVNNDANKLVAQFGYLNEQEQHAMLRGVLFARQLVFLLYGERAIVTIPELPVSPNTGLVVESIREATCEKVMGYISDYPWIGDVLGAYIPELDPRSLYGHRIEEIGGYIIMQAEAAEAEWIFFDQANNLRPEDIIGR